jgi:hypothetical protein
MKQIIQDLKRGNTILEEVPAPSLKKLSRSGRRGK